MLQAKPLLEVITDTQRKYLEHVQQESMGLIKDLKGRNFKRFVNMPVCPKCERLCMYDRRPGDPPARILKDEWGNPVKEKPYTTCPYCGYHGPSSFRPLKVHIKSV